MAEDSVEPESSLGAWGSLLKEPTEAERKQQEERSGQWEQEWQDQDKAPERTLEGFKKVHGREPSDDERNQGLGLAPRELSWDRKLHNAGIGTIDLMYSAFGSLGPEKDAKLAQIKQEINQEFGPVKPVEPSAPQAPTPPPSK